MHKAILGLIICGGLLGCGSQGDGDDCYPLEASAFNSPAPKGAVGPLSASNLSPVDVAPEGCSKSTTGNCTVNFFDGNCD